MNQSSKKCSKLFNYLSVGIFQSTAQGRFIIANQVFADILGYDSIEELLSVNIEKEIYLRPYDRHILLDILLKEGRVSSYRLPFKRKDGKVITVSLDVKDIYEKEGEDNYFIGTIRDVSDEVLLERQQAEAFEDLKSAKEHSDKLAREAIQASDAKSHFVASMSHEIRTPMNGVLGFLDLIEQDVYDSKEELLSFVAKARSAAESLLDIINNILDISKIEAGYMELEEVDFNLREVVNEAILIISTMADEKRLMVSGVISEQVPFLLTGDPVRLRQIFSNLLSNAVKFTSYGNIEINVTLKNIQDGMATIIACVSDNGIGIPKNKLEMLFKPFSQVTNNYTRMYHGTGLGLRICKEFVTLMGGEIGIESTEGEGSKFYFTAKFKTK
ncbi:MAG: ATP-binding protein [Ignavibacteria bacterium]